MKYYSEKLKDPRWQKKRLQILNRDQFKCRFCSDDKTELHVHHLKYKCNPWDAHDEDLQTLCKHCHKFITILLKESPWIQDEDFITGIVKEVDYDINNSVRFFVLSTNAYKQYIMGIDDDRLYEPDTVMAEYLPLLLSHYQNHQSKN